MSVASVGYAPVSPMPILDSRGQVKPELKLKPESAQIQKEQQRQLEQQFEIKDLERVGQAFNKKLQFVVDHTSNEVLVKVIDRETDKVIKVIPPEELQRLHKNLKEAIGLLLDEMV